MEELSQALLKGEASMRRPDIGYGGREFRAAMGKMCEFYLQYHAVVCCDDFDGTAYLLDIARKVQAAIAESGEEIPHLKLLAWEPEGDFGKVDLIGKDRDILVTRPFEKRCRDVAVLLNGSGACPAERMEKVGTEAVNTVSEEYKLELMIFKTESMGMG